MKLLGFAMVLAFCLLALPSASLADNHQTFTDAVGDDSGGYAPDITSLDITSTNAGDIQFKVSINEQGGTFYVGDTLEVLIDSDNNGSDGFQGADTGLFVFTSTGQLDFEFCNFNSDGTRDCSTYASDEATDVKTGPDSHMVTFSNSFFNWFTLNVSVVGSYQDPQNPGAGTFTDRAPDQGRYIYDVKADSDGDGVSGTADKCPLYKGGKLDKNGDGCPPFLPVPHYSWQGGHAFGGFASFSAIRATNAASAVTVTARFAGLVSRRRGPGALPGVPGHRFRVGSQVIFFFTNPNYFGSYKIARITSSGGLTTIKTGCTAPGTIKIIPCPKL
jgi:hypothetical protein